MMSQGRRGRIFALCLLAFGIYLISKFGPVLNRFFERVNSEDFRDDPTVPVMVFGLLCVTAVCIVKLLCKSTKD